MGGRAQTGEGCHLKGFMLVNKVGWRVKGNCCVCLPVPILRRPACACTRAQVAGNFHIAFGDSIVKDGRHIHQFIPSEAPFFNVSHRWVWAPPPCVYMHTYMWWPT